MSDPQDDATFWHLVADGINHHPDCERNAISGTKAWGLCLRCQSSDAERRLARLRERATQALNEAANRQTHYDGCDCPLCIEAMVWRDVLALLDASEQETT